MILHRYDIRDDMMGRANQTRRYSKVLIILMLLLCFKSFLYAAIILETPQTEVKVFVTDRMEERKELPASSLVFPLCSIVLTAKHHGKGYLEIYHTPLSNGLEMVSYNLLCDNLGATLPDILTYKCNPSFPLTIPLTKISAELSRVLQGDRSSYHSEVFLHVWLDT